MLERPAKGAGNAASSLPKAGAGKGADMSMTSPTQSGPSCTACALRSMSLGRLQTLSLQWKIRMWNSEAISVELQFCSMGKSQPGCSPEACSALNRSSRKP